VLQKVIGIRNVGRFRNYGAVGDVTLRRVNLIFAENGRGKTTLCAVLRSLAADIPAFIIGRKTLGSPDEPYVQLLVAGQNISFRDGSWTAQYRDIAIFDATYVTENVYAGDVVDTENRRNLYRVIIGAGGVNLAARVNELDGQIRTKNTELRNSRIRLERFLSPGLNVDAFLAVAEDVDIDKKIAAKEQELAGVQRAAQLQQRAGPSAIPVPAFPTAFAEILGKTLPDVAADADKQIAKHIAEHAMKDRGEQWLSEGLGYVAQDACPFCGQGLSGTTLVKAYQDFFSAKYHALRDEVTGLSREVEAALGDRITAAIEQLLSQNINAVDFWREYCDVTLASLAERAAIGAIIGTLRASALSLLETKVGAPLDSVAPDDAFTKAFDAFERLRTSLAGYNAGVAAFDAIVVARKRDTQAASVPEVELSLSKMKATKARYTDEVKGICSDDERAQAEKKALEAEKERVRQELDDHTRAVITLYGQSINRYLNDINAGFRISTPTHTYRGGTPNTSYQIIINQNSVDLGDADTGLDRPSFRNTLSSGDRSTLALAFFFAQLEQDPDRARKVVVFDDPFTSMDNFRRNHTVHQIFRCANTAAQVIVLSHDPNFLKLLWDRAQPADRKTLQFARVGEENTTIAEWDIEKAVMARYRAQSDDLQRFFSLGEGPPRDIIQKMRPVLEAYCRNLYPMQFDEQESLGNIVAEIHRLGAAHPLYPIVEDLDELNVYCRRYHHGENPSAATEPVDDAELQSYVKRTLSIIGYLV
jgi:wobble nucleotide-excising tRNase